MGPTVVVPPQHLMAPSAASEIADGLEKARHSIAAGAPLSPVATPPETSVTDKYAYAFDIDGVLIRGGAVIPEAIEAMKMLNGENEYGIKVPYIFVTNGGGKTEAERCVQLSQQLEMEVSPGQFICGHTPMREMAEKFNTVLVVGGEGEKCRLVAEGYGFKDVYVYHNSIKQDYPNNLAESRLAISSKTTPTQLLSVSSQMRSTKILAVEISAKLRSRRSLCSPTHAIGHLISRSSLIY